MGDGSIEVAEMQADASVHAMVAGILRAAEDLVPLFEDDVHLGDGFRTFSAWLGFRYRLRRGDARLLADRVEALRNAREEGTDVAAAINDDATAAGLGDLDVIHRRGSRYDTGFAKAEEAPTPEDLDKVLRAEQIARQQAETAKAAADRDDDTSILDVQRSLALQGRKLTFHTRDDGTATLTATGPVDEMDTIRRAVERAAGQAFDALPKDEDVPALAMRLFDALHAICSGGLSMDPAAELATVIVHTTPELNRAWLSDGTAVAPSSLGRYLDSCRLRMCEDDEYGNVLRFADTIRTVTGPLRTSIIARDGGCCAVPGCHVTWNLHVHHIIHVEDGGRTIVRDLTTLCWFHHREHHEGRLPIIGIAPNGLGFYTPDGTQRLARGQSGWHAPPWIDVNLERAERLARRPDPDDMWTTNDDGCIDVDVARQLTLLRLHAA